MPILLLLLMFLLASPPLFADDDQYKMAHVTPNDKEKRDTVTIALPAGAEAPRFKWTSPKTLQMTFPEVQVITLQESMVDKSHFISEWRADVIPEKELGTHLTIEFKEDFPYLQHRMEEVERGKRFTLEVRTYPLGSPTGPTKLLEGRAITGRDGTLLVIAFSGHGWTEKDVSIGTQRIKLRWPEAKLAPGWRDIKAEGLVERVFTYDFTQGGVEMQVNLHPQTTEAHFYQSSEAGIFVVELRFGNYLGRAEEVEELIKQRRITNRQGKPRPLDSLDAMFIEGEEKVTLNEEAFGEAFFYHKALNAERHNQFKKARAFLDTLVKLFPETKNREFLDIKRLQLAQLMEWQPGWILSELQGVLARHPNTTLYPQYRLLQLRLLNDAGLFERSSAIIDDPNLPKDSAQAAIEQGRTAMGLRRWDDAKRYLNEVLRLDRKNGLESATAHFFLARVARMQGNISESAKLLDEMSDDHVAWLSNNPDWLMEMGEIYFERGSFQQAINHFIRLLDTFPGDKKNAHRALLRTAEARSQLNEGTGGAEGDREKNERSALNLFNQLLIQYPDSDSALWARIYRLQLQKNRDVEDRLKELEEIIALPSMSGAVVEAYLQKALLQGLGERFADGIRTLNQLLVLSNLKAVVDRANTMKHNYLEKGMQKALRDGRPEYAIYLAELHGDDWRQQPRYENARVYLAEALARLGLYQPAKDMLAGLGRAPAPQLSELVQGLRSGELLRKKRENQKQATGKEWVTQAEARVRLDAAEHMAQAGEWEGVLLLLERLQETVLGEAERVKRLRLLAKAEAGRGRFPQAVANLETLLFDKPVGDGMDHFWYATLLQMWKGEGKSVEAFQKVADQAENAEIRALAHVRLADIAQLSGQWQEAKKHYDMAAAIYPGTTLSKVSLETASQLQMGR